MMTQTQVQPVYRTNQERIVKLREYRSRLVNEVHAKTDKFIVDLQAGNRVPETFGPYVRKVQDRVRLINAEIDRLIAA
jgi:hypothetical protein